MKEKDEDQTSTLLITIIVSGVVGGLMSLYVNYKYGPDILNISTLPVSSATNLIWASFLFSITFLFIVLVFWVILKLIWFVLKIIVEPINTIIFDNIYKKLKNKGGVFGEDGRFEFNLLYKKYPDLFKLILVIIMFVLLRVFSAKLIPIFNPWIFLIIYIYFFGCILYFENKFRTSLKKNRKKIKFPH